MKKKPFIVLLLGILAFSLTQNCTYTKQQPETGQARDTIDSLMTPAKKVYVPKETVTIYLACIKQTGENGDTTFHLALFDANGDFGVDNLTTVYFSLERKPGNIKWRKVHESGIKKIVEIKYAGDSIPVIFKNGVKEKPGDEWDLNLTEDIVKSIGEAGLIEKYSITFIPEESDVPVPIDPYLRVTPTP